MSRLPLFLIAAAIALTPLQSVGEIYRWVDENGKVRFSDRPPPDSGDGERPVSKVDLKDTGGIRLVRDRTPIRYEGKGAARGVLLEGLSIKLPDANRRDVRVGYEFTGPSCSQRRAELFWTQGFADVGGLHTQRAISEEFVQAGYRLRAAFKGEYYAGEPEGLSLSGTLTSLRVHSCKSKKSYRRKSSASAYVKIEWLLTDKLHRAELGRFTTEGSYDGMRGLASNEGLNSAVKRAYVSATRALLAEPEFVAMLGNQSKAKPVLSYNQALPLRIDYGDGTGSFRERVKALKAASVTVRTVNGHGSGVVLGDQGFVLTNAHVVGDSSVVLVLIGGIEYQAQVTRKEGVRDVALLKINDYNSPGPVTLSRRAPETGDSILVIGTPLDEFYSHTVTKGIISAYRERNGQAFFQTDAAINKGNSGGPVFNEAGELVAIAVAGVFTRGGASLNLNYLIPVHDAMKALNLSIAEPAELRPDATAITQDVERHAEPVAAREPGGGKDAYSLYQQAQEMKVQGNFLRAEKLLEQALGQLRESDPNYAQLRDELYFHLPLTRARAHIVAHDHAAANSALKPVAAYLRDHPKRFEYSAQLQAVLESGKFLQQAIELQAQAGLTPVRVMMKEFFAAYGHYPETHDDFLELLQQHPVFIQRYALREYVGDQQSYRAVFYDTETGRSAEISG